MKRQKSISKTIAMFCYAILVLLFSTSIFGIIHLQKEHSSGISVYNYFDQPNHKRADFALAFSNSFDASSFSNIEMPDRWQITFWHLILIVSICFFGLCIGAPLYIHMNYTQPAKRLQQALEEVVTGKNIEWKLSRDEAAYSLSSSVKKLIDLHANSEAFIKKIGEGNLDVASDNIDVSNRFGQSLLLMQNKLRQLSVEEKNNLWIGDNLSRLEHMLKTESDFPTLVNQVIALITKSVSAGVGVLYGIQDDDVSGSGFFYLLGANGFYNNTKTPRQIFLGEGQLGEMGVQRKTIILRDVPKGYLVIHSGLGSSTPTDVIMVPLLFKDGLYGAIELASFKPFEEREVKWIERAAQSIAAHFFNKKINEDAKRKLEELADKQAEELVEIHRLQKKTYQTLELKLREVEEEKHKSEAILQGCVDGVITFNERGDINFCNPVACEIFGYSKTEILHKRIFELIPVRIDAVHSQLKPFYLSANQEKEINVRTEACVKNFKDEDIDVLITSTQVHIQNTILFTFFIQKISVDLF